MTALFMSMAWVPVAIPVVHQVGLCGVQKVLLMSTGSSMSSGSIVDILNKSLLFFSKYRFFYYILCFICFVHILQRFCTQHYATRETTGQQTSVMDIYNLGSGSRSEAQASARE